MTNRSSERITAIGGVAFAAGLVAWYAGASSAIDLLLSAFRLATFACVIGAAAGIGALGVQGIAGKGAISNALFTAAGVAFIAFTLAALVNRHADGSEPRAEAATLVGFYHPAKEGPRAKLTWRGGRVSIRAVHAEHCAKGSAVTLAIRAGALGSPWIERVLCDASR